MKLSFLKRIRIPHVFALLTGVILFCSVLTYIIPSGSYQREVRKIGSSERTVVIPGTYARIPKHYSLKGAVVGEEIDGAATPVGLVGFLAAIPRGMESAAGIIFFIFIIGGVFGILQRVGTVSAVLQKMLDVFGNSGPLLTVVLMIVIGIGGSTLGMGEELIPLVPIFLIVSQRLGYDRIYGLALVIVAVDVGFAAATTNPFTVQIAQGIAEVPLGSGLPVRLVFFAVCMTLTLIYVLRYGARIKKDPSKSIMAGDDFADVDLQAERHELTGSQIGVVTSCLIVFVLILAAVQYLGWWLAEMAGGFLLMGFLAVAWMKLPVSEATKAFVKGMEEMVVAALVVGFAKGIEVVLSDGKVMDTVIFFAASLVKDFPNYIAAEGMLVFQTILNFFIPSGSGQAAVTMPLMAPLSDVLGLSRQSAVFAFTCGDGFSNMVIPTSGILMAMLALAKIPYEKWIRFMFPLFLQLMLVSALFLAAMVLLDLN